MSGQQMQLQPELFQDMTVTIPDSELGPAMTFQAERSIGSGSFGVVFRATTEDGDALAIKKVFQDRRYRNRELQIIIQLHPHNFIVRTRNYYYSVANSQTNGNYLNLVMDYFPENAYQVYRSFARHGKKMPLVEIKLYTYQFLRGLAWMHVHQVANRDLKPQNTLINRQTGHSVLCDLGSAKLLDPKEPNIAYICSRYYRAPELVFGSRFYNPVIDVWSFACVVAEMIISRPLFPGQSPIDQLVEIIKVLGPPTLNELKAMNPQLKEYNFPSIQTTPINQVLQTNDPAVLDFFSNTLKYSPQERFTCFKALAHPFYDEVRQGGDPNELGLYLFNEKEEQQIIAEIGEEGLKKLKNL